MHTKLVFILAVLAIVTGSASEAQAAAPAPVPGVTHAPRPAAMLGRGGIGATGAAASQRRMAHPRDPRKEADQRSLPDRVTPATGSGTMIQPTQLRRPDVSANPVTAYVVNSGANTVTPITTATNTASTPIPVGGEPHAITITPDRTTAYVVNFASNTVTPITTATNTAGPPITVGNDPLCHRDHPGRDHGLRRQRRFRRFTGSGSAAAAYCAPWREPGPVPGLTSLRGPVPGGRLAGGCSPVAAWPIAVPFGTRLKAPSSSCALCSRSTAYSP